jgi:uncharacterized protein (TIGR02678 family)
LNQAEAAPCRTTETDISDFIERSKENYGRYWRKSAREPGSEQELARLALERLQKLKLIAVSRQVIQPLPALARFAVGTTEIVEATAARASHAL